MIIVPEVLQPIEFVFFAPTRREGDIEQKNCFPPVQRWTDGIQMFSLFIYLSGICQISGITFFQPSFKKKMITAGRPVRVFCIKSEPGCFFLMTLPQEKNSGSMFPPLPVICFECA